MIPIAVCSLTSTGCWGWGPCWSLATPRSRTKVFIVVKILELPTNLREESQFVGSSIVTVDLSMSPVSPGHYMCSIMVPQQNLRLAHYLTLRSESGHSIFTYLHINTYLHIYTLSRPAPAACVSH